MGTHNLFGAKVRLPERRNSILLRDRLVARLAALKPGQTGVVYAPAGYGKTTLAIDVVRDGRASVCWLSLDEFDRDINRFLDYLALAVTGKKCRPG
jgi:LuxR family maltose regulon positive regulatory protein